MAHDQSHDHDHDHDHTAPPSEMELRVKALETLLVEKGIVNTDAIDELIQTYEFRIGPKNGAKVVARAWIDPEYKKRLLENSTAAIAELGFSGIQGEDMTVVENTDSVHNVTVCTLCSCYPWPTLGLPPTWYKSAAYRSRIVLEPRAVLKEFGLEVSAQKEVRVWDSNADLRYLVLPQRPAGTCDWTEEQLIELVTRDSMIGVGVAAAPTL
ncbi:nitrile hydratase [Pseudomonas asturiensis]|uniref:nitrile hydratase n=1 Tax=Pseudomonas asturiensis TaxID=1190415 RepID=A0A1M7PUH2_9PSED|nr:nitrile hydratase subunit alpha [Pseudomonas asturiensis]SHN21111.1 nitrile hydratase [Pseudomonas asturiensis]